MDTRFSRLILIISCVLHACIRGRATRVPKNPKTIIVVLTGKLGDIVCGTPVLRALRAHYPNARILVSGAPVVTEVLANSGLFDEYLDLYSEAAFKRTKEIHADAALLVGPSFRPAAILYLAGVPLIVVPQVMDGYSPVAHTPPNMILRHLVTTFPYRMKTYAPRERLRVLEPLGIVEEDTAKHLAYSDYAAETISTFFRQSSIDIQKDLLIGIAITAGHKIKEWPLDRFAAVADYVIETWGARVIFTGGSADRVSIEKTISHMRCPQGALGTQGMFTVDQLKALIANLHLFIAVDTGPIYIAEAFGVPTVDITGPIDEREQPPRGRLHRVVVPSERAGPQLFVLNARSYDYAEAVRQVTSITVSQVTREVNSLLNELRR